ncbi:hypothetical protein LguiA_005055 [Lonicera macranthoides]
MSLVPGWSILFCLRPTVSSSGRVDALLKSIPRELSVTPLLVALVLAGSFVWLITSAQDKGASGLCSKYGKHAGTKVGLLLMLNILILVHFFLFLQRCMGLLLMLPGKGKIYQTSKVASTRN